MKHTPPKWKVKKTLGYSIAVGDKYIAGVHGQEKKVKDDSKALGYRYDNSETLANANLIAAAPEMLELLKDILVEVRPEISRINTDAGQTIFNPVATETIDMAKELISKAEGK